MPSQGIDPGQIQAGLSLAQTIWVSAGGWGCLETLKWAWGKIAERRQAQRAADAKRIQDASDAGRSEAVRSHEYRKDANDEVWRIADERKQEIAVLKSQVVALQSQNRDQQGQLNQLAADHNDCERRHNALERKVAELTGTVTRITNGNRGDHA